MALRKQSLRPVRIVAITAVLLLAFTLLSRRNGQAGLFTRLRPGQIFPSTFAAKGSLLSDAKLQSVGTTQAPVSSGDDHGRMNATFISLTRNSDLEGMLDSINEVEARFNHAYHYDWVFLNEVEFTPEFVAATTAATSGRARYGRIPEEQWSYPTGLDQQFAAQARVDMARDPDQIPYADSESYRHMCRYQSGFFYRHPLVLEYEWYWRVEPNIELYCDIPYDPFRYMADHKHKYGFVITLNEISKTVPSMWTHVRAFMEDFPQYISNNSHTAFVSEDGGLTTNHCHFWDNFEIANLDWFRSEAYTTFFEYLDSAGGFFYERWGDAMVHSVAASLMLDKGEIHFFDDIGYHHFPLSNCPRSEKKRQDLNCRCKEKDNMDWSPSCTKRFFEVAGIEFPEGYDRNVPPEPNVLLNIYNYSPWVIFRTHFASVLACRDKIVSCESAIHAFDTCFECPKDPARPVSNYVSTQHTRVSCDIVCKKSLLGSSRHTSVPLD